MIDAHTPAPWEISSVSQDTGAIGIAKDRILIAEAHNGYSFMDVVRGDHPEMQRANARLIAAAPDCYECTVLMESLCVWLMHRFGPGTPEWREAQFRLDKARGVVAKAQGIAAPTGGETRSGSTEGKSPTPTGDASETPHLTPGESR